MRPLLILLLVVLAIGLLPNWPYSAEWGFGYYPSGLLALALIVLLIVAATGSRVGPPV